MKQSYATLKDSIDKESEMNTCDRLLELKQVMDCSPVPCSHDHTCTNHRLLANIIEFVPKGQFVAKTELLPCPFCGGEASKSTGQHADKTPWHYIECLNCAASAEPSMWNQRLTGSDSWVVWSHEHRGWWPLSRNGYVPHLKDAGRFTLAEATAIVQQASNGIRGGLPQETMMPVPEFHL